MGRRDEGVGAKARVNRVRMEATSAHLPILGHPSANQGRSPAKSSLESIHDSCVNRLPPARGQDRGPHCRRGPPHIGPDAPVDDAWLISRQASSRPPSKVGCQPGSASPACSMHPGSRGRVSIRCWAPALTRRLSCSGSWSEHRLIIAWFQVRVLPAPPRSPAQIRFPGAFVIVFDFPWLCRRRRAHAVSKGSVPKALRTRTPLW
jgi:hypothetical protein